MPAQLTFASERAMPPKAAAKPKAATRGSIASAAGGARQPGTSGALSHGGAAVLGKATPEPKAAASSKAAAKSKAAASKPSAEKPKDGRTGSKPAKLDAEALEVFEKYEPDGRADGKLKLAQFANFIRDTNIKKLMLWGDEPGPIVKQEWTKVEGFVKKEINLTEFTAWYPTFLETVELKIAEDKAEEERKEQEALAARQAKLDRCSGDGVWKVPLNEIEFAMDKAVEKGKTPLIIDNTENQRVETYFTYRSCYVVECKKWIMEKATKKTPPADILKEERERFFRAKCFKHGQTVMFRLATTACDLNNTFSSPEFPSTELLNCEAVKKVLGIDNASNFKGSPFEKMCPDSESLMEYTTMGVHEKFNVLAITLFKEEDYEGYLKDMIPLPYLQPIKPYVDS